MPSTGVCGFDPPCAWRGPTRDDIYEATQDTREHLASHGVQTVADTLDIPA